MFSVPTHKHAAYQLRAAGHNFRKYVLRHDLDDMPPLYEHEGVDEEKSDRRQSGAA